MSLAAAFEASPYSLPEGFRVFLSACREEIKTIETLAAKVLPTGPCRFEGKTLATRLAASRNQKHSCAFLEARQDGRLRKKGVLRVCAQTVEVQETRTSL